MAERQVDDLVALDRDVARAANALDRWRSALADRPDEAALDDPLEGLRSVAGKSTWERLGELAVSATEEPLRVALRRWVLALVHARIGAVDDAALALEVHAPRGRFEGDRPREVSWREAWRGVASARTAVEARLWLDAAADAAPTVVPIAGRRGARRIEVARRMGFEHPWDAAPVRVAPLRRSAWRFLERTDDLSRVVWREALGADVCAPAVLHGAVGREAGDGWPARLTPRWLEELFGEDTRGLRLELPTLPKALGASSFARALAVFGYALRVASAPGSTFFALARDPWFVGAHRLGFVFGTLAMDAEFFVRALGVGRRVALHHARVLARTALLEARMSAARVLAGSDDPVSRDTFEEIARRVLGSPLDRRLHGAWPAARVDEPARWLAMLLTSELRALLRDRFDDDWFRNPRAWEHLRAQGSGPAFEAVEESSIETGGDALVRSFEHALG
jgi:hypothetical protein